jgi:hypothetical protein
MRGQVPTEAVGDALAPRWREVALAALFFLVVAYTAFGANLFAGDVVAPMDLLSQFSGYTESGTARPLVNVEMGDVLDAVLPPFRHAKHELLAGRLPLWNPLPAGGEPLLPLIFNGLVSPRFLFFLLLPNGLGYTLGLIVQLALGGLGTYLLCRRGVGILPAALGGVTFMLSGFNSSWTQWPHVSTSIWIPWLLWALGRLERDTSPRNVTVLAGMVALLVFGGFPSVAGYGFYFAGVLGVVLLVSHGRRRGPRSALTFGAVAALAAGLGLMLTAAQLVPSLDYLQQFDFSARAGHATGLSPETIRALVDPDAIKAQWTEQTAYVGILPLVLTVIVLVDLCFGGLRQVPVLLSPIAWLGLLAFTLSATYSTPAPVASLLYRLPILNFNPSGRMSSVMALAFAVLAALGADAIFGHVRAWLKHRASTSYFRFLPAALLGVLLLAQGLDEGRTLGQRNGHAGKKWFFPLHQTIRFVRDRLGPDESVLAVTDAYMLPGTLGSYGIPEWFGHSFHRSAEKRELEKLVKEPWAPGTSARVAFDHIQVGEPLLDRLGVRFILLASGDNPLERLRQVAVEQRRVDTPVGLEEMQEGLSVGQTFTLDEAVTVCALRLQFGTYHQAHGGADVQLLLTGSNGVSAEATLAADAIRDNEWADFSLPSVPLPPGDYSFRVGLAGSDPAHLAVWSSLDDSSYLGGTRLAGNALAGGDLAFKILKCDPDPNTGWRIARSNENLWVLENTEATPGAFLMAKDAPPDAPPLDGTVRLLAHTGDQRRYEVTTATPALLVRAARFWPGFEATVDGVAAPVTSYAALFQAIPVPAGTHVVDVRYVPTHGRLGLLLSALAGVVMIVLGTRRSNRPTSNAP